MEDFRHINRKRENLLNKSNLKPDSFRRFQKGTYTFLNLASKSRTKNSKHVEQRNNRNSFHRSSFAVNGKVNKEF